MTLHASPITITMIALMVLLAGCGIYERPRPKPTPLPNSPEIHSTVLTTPQPQPPVELPSLRGIDNTDATQVSRTAMTLLWTMDTTTDRRPNDAALRSLPLLADPIATDLSTFSAPSGPGSDWQQWSRHRAYTQVQVSEGTDERPGDTATTALRQWRITIRPVGRDGWRGQPQHLVIFVELGREDAGQPWKITRFWIQ